MGFYRFLANYAMKHAGPALRSISNAYKHVIHGKRSANNQEQSQNQSRDQSSGSSKKHFTDQFFSSILSQANLSAPRLDRLTALKILNVEPQAQKQLGPNHILDRYYTLWKKNDPSVGGNIYLQSKVFNAKECLMNQYPDAAEIEQKFYKQVVEPEQKAAEEQNKQNGDEQQKQKDEKEEKKKQ